jgi:hypothetical protein
VDDCRGAQSGFGKKSVTSSTTWQTMGQVFGSRRRGRHVPTGFELTQKRVEAMRTANAQARERARKVRARRNRAVASAAQAAQWRALCAKITSWKEEACAYALSKRLHSVHAALRDALVPPDPALAPTASVTALREWALGQAVALRARSGGGSLAPLQLRVFAAMLVEVPPDTPPWVLVFNCMYDTMARKALLSHPLLHPTFPTWSTHIVPGAHRDPYLGLHRMQGPVTYTYLEPKPEWKDRHPYLPALVLLGDTHKAKGPCKPSCAADAFCKELGGPSHSFLRYLDTHHDFCGLPPDFLYEGWVPKHERGVAMAAEAREDASASGPLVETRGFVRPCVGPRRAPSCELRRVRVHVADLRDLFLEPEAGFWGLLDALAQAVEAGTPAVFLDACKAAFPEWPFSDIVCALLSLNVLEDLQNGHLRRERSAHEFYQLDAELQREVLGLLHAIPTQEYPYDIAKAVNEWLAHGSSPVAAHPFLVVDILALRDGMDAVVNRRLLSLEVYALSRVLKRRHASTCTVALGVLFAGVHHCMSAAYLLHTMYNIHGAAAAETGCLNFRLPSQDVFRMCRKFAREHREQIAGDATVLYAPHSPMAWP